MPVVAVLQLRGISLLWGPRTDVRLWRSLIEQAATLGGSKACTLSTYTSSGEEIVVEVTIRLQPNSISTSDNPRPLQLNAWFVPRDGDDTFDSGVSGSDSAEDECNNTSDTVCAVANDYDEGVWLTTGKFQHSDMMSNCVVSSGVASQRLPMKSQDLALRLHLKAMRLRQQQHLQQRGGAASPGTPGVTSGAVASAAAMADVAF